MRRVLVLTVLLLALGAADARAQSQANIGLGLAITSDDPSGSLGLSSTSIGPLIRIKLGTGLGPSLGFDWYNINVEAMAGSEKVFVGEVRVHPVMGGIAYNWKRGQYWISASLVGGYSFNRLLDTSERSVSAFQSSLGVNNVSFRANDSLVYRGQLGLWYDAGPRVGLTASIAYMGLNNPTMSIGTERGVFHAPMHLSSVVLTFGLVYGIF